MSRKKRSILLTVVSICFLAATSQAQSTSPFLGTKTPYPSLSQQNKYTKPPQGFKPVFVNYTGRHGARFLTKAGSDVRVLQLLLLAEQKNGLTDMGRQVKKMTERFLTIEKNNYENITLLGAKEQAAIGKRVFDNYADAFTGGDLDIVTTYKVRTQQSADAFLTAFKPYKGEKKYQVTPDSLDTVLRFYDLSPAYQEYKKNAMLQASVDSLNADARTAQTAANVCAKIFTQSFAAALLKTGVSMEVDNKTVKADAISFSSDLYDLYCVQFSIPLEMKQKGYPQNDINFGIAFTQKDLEWLDFKNSAEDFLEKGAAFDTLGIQVKVAVPLLADYINSTDAIVNNKNHSAGIFRFTHAEAIAPFATLLGIGAASSPVYSVFQYKKHWSAAGIIPLSANIHWVLYSNGREYLVKVLHNEKEVALPVATATYPYYKWKDVKEYYLKKMTKLQAGPQQDMHAYLLHLK